MQRGLWIGVKSQCRCNCRRCVDDENHNGVDGVDDAGGADGHDDENGDDLMKLLMMLS